MRHRRKKLDPNNETRIIQEEKNKSAKRKQMLAQEEARIRREELEKPKPVNPALFGLSIGLRMGGDPAHAGLMAGLAGIDLSETDAEAAEKKE